MDRQSLTGFVLIAVIITVWMIYNSSHTAPPLPTDTKSDSSVVQSSATTQEPSVSMVKPPDSLRKPELPEQIVTIETDKYIASISSKGMSISKWQLKGFNDWRGNPVQLIKQDQREFAVNFTAQNGQKVDTRYVDFSFAKLPSNHIVVHAADSFKLEASMTAGTGASLVRTLSFHGSTYLVDASVKLVNMDNVLPNTQRWFELGWAKGLQFQEANSVDESNSAVAFASLNGSLDELDAANYNEQVSSRHSGTIDFIGTKSKYFIASILNRGNSDVDDFLEGIRYGAPDQGVIEEYSAAYRIPYRGGTQTHSFSLYLGPLDYDIVSALGMASTVNFGWKWIVRPIGEWVMLPVLKVIYTLIPNFGIAIIVFSLLMKLLLTPLGMQQMRSAQKMKVLQPEIEKLRKQHQDSPTAMQQAQMKLYGEYGINPMGGCLPLLLQMPILYALYSVLTSNIHMRQAMFIPGWIPDLSIPDHIVHLPFSIVGVHALSGMALIMGISMFIQQKMTITDPNQKAMVYMMPVMLTMMFSNLPSGLNLYYLVFNFLGIAQQYYMNNFSKTKLTLADLKRAPKKEGWLQKRMRLMQEMAEEQGRPLPKGFSGQNEGSQNQKKRKK